jgi:pimeloyl-ACP methyl ester carboxylesterase
MYRRLGSVAIRGGVTLPFVEQGRPSGIPVILLHGFTDSWTGR